MADPPANGSQTSSRVSADRHRPRAASEPRVAAASAPLPASAASRPAKPARDPAAILAGQPVPDPTPAEKAASVVARSAKPGVDPFVYFVQAGAFAREEDAEAQRAKLAMQGFAAKVTEREQSGRQVYRVRLGPFDFKEDADSYQAKLQAAGADAAIVRIFRQ